MDSHSQSLCAETKKSFLGHLWLIQTGFCLLPKRINNIKKPSTSPHSDSYAIYIFTVNNLLPNQVRHFFVLIANRLI